MYECEWGGQKYSENSTSCQNGKEMKCRGGQWTETGYTCNPPGDVTRINVSEDSELRYWASELRATPEEIKAAVAAAGDMVTDVRSKLRR